MNRFIRCLLVLLTFIMVLPVFSQSFEDYLITDRGRGSLEKPNLYDRNKQRLREEGRYRSPAYYQQGSDNSYYYQTPNNTRNQNYNNVPEYSNFPR